MTVSRGQNPREPPFPWASGVPRPPGDILGGELGESAGWTDVKGALYKYNLGVKTCPRHDDHPVVELRGDPWLDSPQPGKGYLAPPPMVLMGNHGNFFSGCVFVGVLH